MTTPPEKGVVKWMTIAEAHRFFGVCRRTIYNWMAKGKFEVQRTPTGSPRVLVDTRGWTVEQQKDQR